MSCDNDSIIEHLVNSVLESVFVGEIFRIHRDLTINKLIGFKEWGEEEDCDTINEGKQSTRKSSISVSLRNHRNIECRCFVCSRMIAAVRFAPHLEKCIGIGRNTRVRRRSNIPAAYEASTSTNIARTTRASTLRSATKTTTTNYQEKVINSNYIEEEKREDEEAIGEEEEEEYTLHLRDRLRNKK
ncbi:hypothetical protein ACQ4LE_009500 [Meloidogyne hapla]|uniref:SAGA-associated factor 11 n=1 Tax=Meloidogyne hapla TaxID=6305 RepID=A0A1I8BDF0_MELHA